MKMALSCEKAQEILRDKFFNEASKEDILSLENHLTYCIDCRNYKEKLAVIDKHTDCLREQYFLFKQFIRR
jgi:predicted anti-sigma-YlaC factor YlaD